MNPSALLSSQQPGDKLPVLCLMGPTASGKTALACQLYDSGKFELVSVDSALIYRDMNIGTAKPTAAELQQYPHALIDLIDPTEVYSAAQFVADVTQCIDDIHQRGKIPLLVGGTMLYFRSLLQGMADNLPAGDEQVRAAIAQEADALGWEHVHQLLAAVDPRAAQRFLPNDHQRVMRALEVYRITGKAISDLHDEQTVQLNQDYDFHLYALLPDRQWLHDRIHLRLEQMWQQGFLEEVIALQKKYHLDKTMPAMRTVGYRQVLDFLEKNSNTSDDLQSMKDKSLFATRQLAKRQYTWLRSLRETHSFVVYNSINDAKADLRIRYR